MLNTNVLKGMRCPQCGQNNCFMINVTWCGQSHVYDDGTDEKSGGNTEWFDDSLADCAECDWSGKAGDLLWPTKIPSKLADILLILLEYVQENREMAITPGNMYPDAALENMDITDKAFEETIDLLSQILEEKQ